MKQRSTEIRERLRNARRNLAQIEELHGLVGRLIKETETLLASIDEFNEPDDLDGHPFHRKS